VTSALIGESQASSRGEILPLRILVAHPYITPEIFSFSEKHPQEVSILIDSGAYTYHQKHQRFGVEQYIDFIKGLPVKPWGYFQLDVIGNPEETRKNLYKMLKAGLEPIPIYTRGHEPEEIEELYKVSDVIALGGISGVQGGSHIATYIKNLQPYIAGRKYHCLGLGDARRITNLKPYSTDCTNHLTARKFGRVHLYMGRGEFVAIDRDTFKKKPPQKILKRIRQLGFDPYHFAKLEAWKGTKLKPRLILSLYSQWLYQEDMRKHVGVNMFFAEDSANILPDYDILHGLIHGKHINEYI